MKPQDKVKTVRADRGSLYAEGAVGVIDRELIPGVWVVRFENGDELAVAERWLATA